MKQKKVLYLSLAVGIIAFFIYGVYHIVYAYNDIKQSQTTNDNLTLDSSYTKVSIGPGGSFCNPLGCVVCSGCISQQYQQNIGTFPVSIVQTEHTY